MYRFLELFYQDYSDEPELRLPSHWCVKYIEEGKGFVDYSYHYTKPEAEEWALQHTDFEDHFGSMFDDVKASMAEIFNAVATLNQEAPPMQSQNYGATPPVLPDEWFIAKEFTTLKESRTNNLYDYFPIWFEDLCEIDGVYLAGGSLRNFLGGDDVIQDIDLFFRDKEALEKAMKIMGMHSGSDDGCWYEAFRCPAGELITYKSVIDKTDEDKTPEDYKNQRKVQFITKSFYESPEQLINTFDFIPTCACIYGGVLYTHPDWVRHVKKRKLGLHFVSYPVATLNRLLKYSYKGYHIPSDTLLGLVIQINENEFDANRLALYVD